MIFLSRLLLTIAARCYKQDEELLMQLMLLRSVESIRALGSYTIKPVENATGPGGSASH